MLLLQEKEAEKSVVQNDVSTNVAIATTVRSLSTLISERKQWEGSVYRTSNAQLYSILGSCYAFYKRMQGEGAEAKRLKAELDTFIEQHNVRFTASSHGITRVVKCVFFDGHKGVDRRRISTYSLVLRRALQEGVRSEAVAQFIEDNGGVQEIRLAKSPNAKTTKMRAEIARRSISDGPVLANFRSGEISGEVNPDMVGQLCVAIVLPKSDGSLDVMGFVDTTGAANAALSAYYAKLPPLRVEPAANDGDEANNGEAA